MLVQDEAVSVKISLTSPLLRESTDSSKSTDNDGDASGDAALLPREPCLRVKLHFIAPESPSFNQSVCFLLFLGFG